MADDATDAPEKGDDETKADGAPDEFKSEESKSRVLADLARERDARQELEAKLKEYEDRDKTELERIEERAAKAEMAAAEREAELARYRVGVAKGLPPDLIGRLRGSTDEELMADADALLALLPAKGAKGAVDQGPRQDESDESQSINDLLRAAARGR